MRYVPKGASPTVLDTTDVGGLTELDRARIHFVGQGNIANFAFEIYKRAAVRQTLRTLFNGKCAYCEFFYDVGYTEDIEHFRPKGRVDREDHGAIISIQPAYWWLGSSWSNLLPSCKKCNVRRRLLLYDGRKVLAGKSCFFPLLDESARASVENGEAAETALLLDPGVDDPVDYLTFEIIDGKCVVVPNSPDQTSTEYLKARHSIDIYGLNRHQLVKQRTERYTDLAAALTNLELLIDSYDTASPEIKSRINAKLLDEKRRITSSFAADTAHSAMAAWLSKPLLVRLGVPDH